MKQRLGIIDWGIGGISVNMLIKSHVGNIPAIYFSDTGVKAYGKMARGALVSRLDRVFDFFRAQGVSHVVVGCNAASTVIPFLNIAGLKVEGIIDCAVRMTAKLHPERLALLGGRRTVLSGVYRRAFAEHGIHVTQRIAQPLSTLIEAGDVSSAALREHCESILRPVRDCSHLLLACTHYPAIMSVISEFISKDTVLINPIGELITQIVKWNLPKGGAELFLTSGDPEQMKMAARIAFGFRIKTATRVDL
jgi:glutamate racemase